MGEWPFLKNNQEKSTNISGQQNCTRKKCIAKKEKKFPCKIAAE